MEAVFLNSVAGRILALHRAPTPGATHRGDVLFVPPFAEEMNRSRRMMTVTAQRLAEIGYGSLVLDLYGTGDSDGEFADARVDTWRGDVARALDWLEARGSPRLGVVGVRFGAMLALDAVARRTSAPACVVLWQPILQGEQMLTQFLRLKLAAAIGGGEGAEVSTQTLRRALDAGEALEIAGYVISPGMAADLAAMRLAPLDAANPARVRWFDIAAEEGKPLSPAGRRLVEAWRHDAPGRLEARIVKGDPFWTLLEISIAPQLVDATCAAVAEAMP